MTSEPGDQPIFERILACVAPSPHLAALAREAVALAEICGSELVFLHVGAEGRQVEDGLGRALPQGLGSAAFVVRSGAPEATILREAAAQGADLIVAGALKSDPVLTSLRGSMARRIARRADRSVLLTTHRHGGTRPARRVVAVVGFDGGSLAMARDVAALARRAGSEAVHFVHEYDGAAARTGQAQATREAHRREVQSREATYRAQLGDLLQALDLEGLPVTAEVLLGQDFTESMRYAERYGADLICVAIAARPIGALDRFFRHPVESVLREFSGSVLLHRPRAGTR